MADEKPLNKDFWVPTCDTIQTPISYTNFYNEKMSIFWGDNQRIDPDLEYKPPTGMRNFEPLKIPRVVRFLWTADDVSTSKWCNGRIHECEDVPPSPPSGGGGPVHSSIVSIQVNNNLGSPNSVVIGIPNTYFVGVDRFNSAFLYNWYSGICDASFQARQWNGVSFSTVYTGTIGGYESFQIALPPEVRSSYPTVFGAGCIGSGDPPVDTGDCGGGDNV